jgi:hypothetical protein
VKGGEVLDLSEMHIKFRANQADTESPNNANIRVYNLSDETISRVSEFQDVVLQAGYEGQFGVIFKGTVMQYRVGREDSLNTYLDILAADGDTAYSFGVVNATLEKGVKVIDTVKAAIGSMSTLGVSEGYIASGTGGVLPRGKVLFGMARDYIRRGAFTLGSTWSIQDGTVTIIPLDGYRPDSVVDLSSSTGLVDIPEQTQNGINFKTLLNPRLQVGGAVRIDNRSVNQLIQRDKSAAPIAFDQYTGLQLLAKVSSDGLYRLFVAEHEGDTRGQAWYSHCVCLAVDPSSNKVKPYG